MELLRKLCSIHAPSGDEGQMTDFLLSHIKKNKNNWKVQPQIYFGESFQEAIVLVFGKPRTAVFAHIDSIGFTAGYDNNLIKIGGPVAFPGINLVAEADSSTIAATILPDDGSKIIKFKSKETIERGTNLTFLPEWIENDECVQCCYMDNRLGVWTALQLAETLEDGIIVFSCREEHSGGSTSYLGQWIFDKFNVYQALICDITWVTDGIRHGGGVAISMRDSGLPRRKYLNRIIDLAQKSGIPFQLEVESAGGSDGIELQRSSAPWEWCFIGAPESNVHSPQELVFKTDIKAMVDLYKYLMSVL
jgi:putative aminopeptidase FrvX